jgi:hypothetical protein
MPSIHPSIQAQQGCVVLLPNKRLHYIILRTQSAQGNSRPQLKFFLPEKENTKSLNPERRLKITTQHIGMALSGTCLSVRYATNVNFIPAKRRAQHTHNILACLAPLRSVQAQMRDALCVNLSALACLDVCMDVDAEICGVFSAGVDVDICVACLVYRYLTFLCFTLLYFTLDVFG